jgi:hypothetical protein
MLSNQGYSKESDMDTVSLLSSQNIGKNFIPQEYLTDDRDEYYYRNQQTAHPHDYWRNLLSDEVECLIKNNNSSDNWDDILVTDQFDPNLIRNSEFFGLVRIGSVRNVILEHHALKVPVGIANSVIISCDIGDDVAIHNVRYLSHYIIGDRNILMNIDEMHTTDHAKFGNGIIKEGEPEKYRIWLELMNETGSRSVLPFNGMISADAYLWAKYRDDKSLMERLKSITQNSFDAHRGYYGTTGNQCVIKNSRILKDVMVGEHCYIKGVNKLKNLTVNSSEQESTQIGEGCELVNGIIGYGCHIFYGCKAVRFIIGDNSNFKYGARVINSFLGDNSTISCCEVLHNLIFPAHEQHHNNSFLIASIVMGQSNMAAGVTVGSNHNSRANDNELQAGRGFWPGLCTSVKHSSRFASFVLLSKANYPAELNVSLPFSLVNNNESKNRLEVMPAYWWLYNMYALARNSWKFHNRDSRRNKVQNIEFDSLAPDTVEEIFSARRQLEIWTATAYSKQNGERETSDTEELQRRGHELLTSEKELVSGLEIIGEDIEKSRRNVVILKVVEAYHAYGDMLQYYAVNNMLSYMKLNPQATHSDMLETLQGTRETRWTNLGGQLVSEKDVDTLRADIDSGVLDAWDDIHQRYDDLWTKYVLDKQKHACATLHDLHGIDTLSTDAWIAALRKAVEIQNYVCEQVYITRNKDYLNPFRQATYRNAAEMDAAIGTIEDNSFIRQVREQTTEFEELVEDIITRV